MRDPWTNADVAIDEMVRRAIRIATATVDEPGRANSVAPFVALGAFLTDEQADGDVIPLRNAALLAVDVLGTNYLIGCEAFVATLRHQLLFSFGEPNDVVRTLVTTIDRRYGRFVAFAAELAASGRVVAIRRR